jgi:hypothetical protein
MVKEELGLLCEDEFAFWQETPLLDTFKKSATMIVSGEGKHN